MRIIDAVKSGDKGDGTRLAMREQASGIASLGAQCVIAGCTEIPLILGPHDVGVPVVSSTDALAEKTVRVAYARDALPRRL